jgi:hypothetical protein
VRSRRQPSPWRDERCWLSSRLVSRFIGLGSTPKGGQSDASERRLGADTALAHTRLHAAPAPLLDPSAMTTVTRKPALHSPAP